MEFSVPQPMPIFLTPPGRGRPTQNPIDLLRTRVWINALMDRTGLQNGYALLAYFEPSRVDEDGITRDKKWVHYVKGRRVPSRRKGQPSAVEIAEAICPGSSVYFDSAMWHVIKKEKMSPAEIDGHLSRLGVSVTNILNPHPHRSGVSGIAFNEFTKDDADALVELGTFDALEALVLLVAKAEAIASHELKKLALSAYLSMASQVIKLPELKGVAREVLTKIDVACKHWVYTSSHSRMDVVIFAKAFVDKQEREARTRADATSSTEESNE